MKHNDKVKAIKFIRTNAEFALRDDELEWLDDAQEKPTDAEIKSGWTAYQAFAKKETQTQAATKAALLERLGITEDEAKLLLS
jgi:hypothetical protein